MIDWSVRDDMREAKERALREAGDDHFYGPWKGGSKAAGGRVLTPEEQEANDATNLAKQEAAWLEHQKAGVVGADEAITALRDGKVANVAPETVGPVLDKLAESAAGVGGEHLDLTELSVNGTLKFGGDGLGLPRSVMPQIPKEAMPDFVAQLKADGIKVSNEMISPQKLAPVQKEISTAKTGRMLQAARVKKPEKVKPVLVSKDNFVLDGHHHWASMTALSFERPGTQMPIVRIGLKHRKALAYVSGWTDKMGFATRGLSESDIWDGLSEFSEADDDHFYGPWKGGSRAAGGHPAGEDTLGKYVDDKGRWDPERVASVHEPYYESVLRGVPTSETPTVYMTGGGPASGKTQSLLKNPDAGIPDSTKAAHIDPDSAKAGIPEYGAGIKSGYPGAAAYAHEESSHMSKQAVARALGTSHDVVYDSVGNSGIDKLSAKVAQMREQGAQRIVARYAVVNTNEAIRRSDARAVTTGRFVPHAYIRQSHSDVRQTIQAAITRGVFDDLKVYDTRGTGPKLIASYTKQGGLQVQDAAAWGSYTSGGWD